MTPFQASLLLIIIGIASIITACYTIWQTRKIARERHTFDRKMARERHTLEFVKDYNDDLRVSEAIRFIRATLKMDWDDKIVAYKDDKNRDNFLFLMNKFETLSIGLDHEIYDRDLIKKFFGREIWAIYDKSQELIRYIRAEENNQNAFLEFEKLATQVQQKTRA